MINLLISLVALVVATAAQAAPLYPSQSSASGLIIGNQAIVSAPGNSAYPMVCTLGQPCFLGVLRAANFNVTTDQAVTISPFTAYNAGQLPAATKYIVTGYYVTNCSLSMTTAQGGLYTAASKGGTALVASTQAYTNCTSSSTLQTGTLTAAAASNILAGATLYFSLTTAQGAAATGDVYIVGIPLN